MVDCIIISLIVHDLCLCLTGLLRILCSSKFSYMLHKYFDKLSRENCIFGTSIVALRSFGTTNIDFVKIALQTLDS